MLEHYVYSLAIVLLLALSMGLLLFLSAGFVGFWRVLQEKAQRDARAFIRHLGSDSE